MNKYYIYNEQNEITHIESHSVKPNNGIEVRDDNFIKPIIINEEVVEGASPQEIEAFEENKKKEAIENGLDINASHFTEKEETFITSDGIEVLVSKSWESSDTLTGENDLQNLINHVKQYGIIVNDTEPISEPFKKGSYKLYILNNELFNKINNFKKTDYMLLGIAVTIIISLITFYLATKS
jgi:hypothetical protein